MGNALEQYPEQARYAIQKGHIIGNHGYDHPKFSEISIEEAKEQIDRTDRLIERLYSQSGIKRPIKVFRFPYLNNGSSDEYEKCDWNNKHVKAIQEILKSFGYSQPAFEKITYGWYKKAGFDRCINIDCTYDSFDWCLKEGSEMFGYHDLPTVLARIDEVVPDSGRGLNSVGSNEIVMMHAFISFDEFKALIEKMLGMEIEFGIEN